MGINNRDYIRDSSYSSGGGSWNSSLTPTIRLLLILNVVGYLLQIFVTRPVPVGNALNDSHPRQRIASPQSDELDADELREIEEEILRYQGQRRPRESIVQNWFELDTGKVLRGQIWRVLTSAFCHSRYSIWHIVFNMLLLWWFGTSIETTYGSREFLLFYLAAAIASSLAFMGLDLYADRTIPAIGASGAVWGVLILFCMHYPRYQVRLYFLIPVEFRFLLALYALYDLHPVLLILSGEDYSTGVAHAAHLGGLVFGFFYYRQSWRLEPLADRMRLWTRLFKGRIVKPSIRLHVPEQTVESFNSTRDKSAALDEVLRKISEHGRESLTDEDEALLEEASKRLGKTRDKG